MELKELYSKANEVAKNVGGKKNELIAVPAVVGKEYFSQPEDNRIMVVGRCVNGWQESYNGGNIENWYKNSLRWVYISDEPDYTPAGIHSKFWQFIKYKLNNELGISLKNFSDYIVWTNLYKIAPKECGNLSNKLMSDKKVRELSDKVIAAEIEFYNPKEIWFITKCNKKNVPDDKERDNWLFETDNGMFVFDKTLQTIKDKHISARLFYRPEFRKFSDIEEGIDISTLY